MRMTGLLSGVISVGLKRCPTEILKPLIVFFPVTRVLVIGGFGLSTASLCATRRIYLIASVRKVIISRAEKRRQVAADLAIGLGLPIMLLILCENTVSTL